MASQVTPSHSAGASKSVGRISSAEGGYVVRGSRSGTFVQSRASQESSKVGHPRSS